ncbi:IS5 family transposase [uncultured Mucilaginibacter sp.]|uniref:IS5 family transposase n=1 Tax=uncultured Mucilaginibacter sp. TaxID=797541 RepID=UPI002634F1F6|nr:IS5 family transposase [uncultured Mucilaginibacter sp.]
MDKDTIEKLIVPYLSKGKRGFRSKVPIFQVVKAIFYRLKTGCQWRELPLKHFINDVSVSWQNVYYYFNKWCRDGSWRAVWIGLLRSYRNYLDLSSVQLDGSHTPAKRGGQAVGYQGRKASKTSNALFLADNTGQMLALSEPQQGQHHDLHEIKKLFTELCGVLKEAAIDSRGIFLNADSGFDSKELRAVCAKEEIQANIKSNPRNNNKENGLDEQYFDEELYKKRTVIEQANAWMDSYKALFIRYETLARNWMAMHWMAFSVFFLNRINKKSKV